MTWECVHGYPEAIGCPVEDCPDAAAPATCPGSGIDDLCTWPDVESCGLCTLGMNPRLR